jgi:hypothetical protein
MKYSRMDAAGAILGRRRRGGGGGGGGGDCKDFVDRSLDGRRSMAGFARYIYSRGGRARHRACAAKRRLAALAADRLKTSRVALSHPSGKKSPDSFCRRLRTAPC